MSILTAVFGELIQMSLTAVPVILIVAALRLALCRAPKRYSYALWLAWGSGWCAPWPSPVCLAPRQA